MTVYWIAAQELQQLKNRTDAQITELQLQLAQISGKINIFKSHTDWLSIRRNIKSSSFLGNWEWTKLLDSR